MDYGQARTVQPPLQSERSAQPEQVWDADFETDSEQDTLINPLASPDEGPEFSSEPMPAAFAACLFLAGGLLVSLVIALFW